MPGPSDPPHNPPNDDSELTPIGELFREISEEITENAKDRQISILQEQVTDLENRLGEERFVWVLIVIVIFDVLVLKGVETWTTPLIIGAIELIGLVIYADRCKVDAVLPLIDRLTGFTKRPRRDDDL